MRSGVLVALVALAALAPTTSARGRPYRANPGWA